jgi:hypothetical protein
MCNGFAILSGSSTFSTIENTQLIANEDTSTIGFVFSNHRTPQTLASFRKKRLLFAFGRRADPTYSAAAAFVQNHAGLSSFRESTTRPQPGDVAKHARLATQQKGGHRPSRIIFLPYCAEKEGTCPFALV